jgi:aspartate racemase
MDFEARLHRAAQRWIPQRWNSGYPPLVVYYCRHPPFLITAEGTPRLPLQPDPRLIDAAGRLGALADFLVITANAPHLFQAEIEQAAGCWVLSMIEVTLGEVRRRSWSRVGVLGLGDPFVYTEPLERLGVACETLDAPLRAELDGAIIGLMEGREDPASAALAGAAIAALRGRAVDGIILGCTEITLLLGGSADAPDLLNPIQLLAEAAVRHALA